MSTKTNVVFQLSCENCDNVYVGKTEKKVHERVNQHFTAVIIKNELPSVFKHCNEKNNFINFNGPQILIQISKVRVRRFLEYFFTNDNPN